MTDPLKSAKTHGGPWKLAGASCAAILLFAACGRNTETVDKTTPTQADDRFSTADGLVDYFNAFSTRDPADYRALVDVVYIETEIQRKLINRVTVMIPVLELSTAVRHRFNDTIVLNSSDFSTLPNGPARIIERSGERAKAEFIDSDGTDATLYLVKVNERWWISGYSFEYDSRNAKDPQSHERSLEVDSLYAKIAPDLTRRVRAGEFASIDEFRAEFLRTAQDYLRQHAKEFPIIAAPTSNDAFQHPPGE